MFPLLSTLISTTLFLGDPAPSIEGEQKPAVESGQAPSSRADTSMPGPLEARPFQLPVPDIGKLNNNIPVYVAPNNEVPLVYVQVVFHRGEWVSNERHPGLAEVTMDMLSEATTELDSVAFSSAKKALAADIGSSAGLDGSSISLSSLKKNLNDSLALLSDVLQRPAFNEQDWEIMQKKYVQNAKADEEDPNQIAAKVWNQLTYGAQYAGISADKDDYQNRTLTEMKQWAMSNLRPENAQIIVGGDTSLDEVLPMLEQHFGSWSVEEPSDENPWANITAKLPSQPEQQASTIYLIDRPGASQSIIRTGQFVMSRTDENVEEFSLANMAVGGLFIARINLNLREDKGWTYGARSYVRKNRLNSQWIVSTSVVREHTGSSLSEIRRELSESKNERQLQQSELDAGRGYLLGTTPIRYESPNYLLSKVVETSRYNLPKDWFQTFGERHRSVSLEAAQTTWNQTINLDTMPVLVVGDVAVIKNQLEELGLPIVMLDTTGKPTD